MLSFNTLYSVHFLKLYMYMYLISNKSYMLIQDPQTETAWPARTLLVISMCFPYGMWLLVYSGKSVFGSHAWPSVPLLAAVRNSRKTILAPIGTPRRFLRFFP